MDESALWDEIGRIHLRIASFDDAVAAFSKAIELNSNHAKYYSDLATAYCLKGRNIEAIALYHKCLELPGSDTERIVAWNKLAEIYGRMDDYRNAAAAYARAAELSRVASGPDDGCESEDENNNNNGRHNLPAAGAERIDTTAATPASGNGKNGRSHTETPQGNMMPAPRTNGGAGQQDPNLAKRLAAVEAAIAARMAARAVAASPDRTETAPSDSLEKMSTMPVRQKQPAISSASKTLALAVPPLESERIRGSQLTPAEPRTWGLVPTPAPLLSDNQLPEAEQGSAYSSDPTGPDEQALSSDVSGKALTQDPGGNHSTPPAFETGPRSYIDDPVEVQRLLNELATYRRITDIAPANDRAWDRIGRISKDLGQYADAIQAFQRAIEIEPGQADYQYHLGLVFSAQKRYEDAITAFLRTVEIDPAHILAHCAVAGCYVRLGRSEEAQKHIDIARPEMETEKEYNRACFEAICGNVDLAIELLRIALQSKQTTMTWVRCDPDLDFIRKDARFQKLVTSEETVFQMETGFGHSQSE